METKKASRKNNEGVALMLVLLFIVLLTTIVFEYAYETQVEASLSYNGKADMEAYIAAKSAIAVGMSMLQADQMQDLEGGMPGTGGGKDPRQQQQQLQNLQNQGGAGMGQYDCKFTDAWGEPVVQPLNNATMQCSIEDEGGKLNLNMFSEMFQNDQDNLPGTNPNTDINNPNTPPTKAKAQLTGDAATPAGDQANQSNQQQLQALEETLRRLFDQMELEVNPTDAILDWLDSDDDTRPDGAENDYYQSLETPYACKNGPMESIEELLLIAGITPEIYFDLNRTPDETQELREQKDPLLVASSLPDLLTCWGSTNGKININSARRELLMAMCQDQATVETILQAQLENPFQDTQDANLACPNELADVKSDQFRIQGDGFVDEVMVRVEAYVARPNLNVEIPEPFRILSWRVIR